MLEGVLEHQSWCTRPAREATNPLAVLLHCVTAKVTDIPWALILPRFGLSHDVFMDHDNEWKQRNKHEFLLLAEFMTVNSAEIIP